MSRPFKKRRICCEPLCMTFRPEGASDEMGCIVLMLDEYETIRLIDFEGLSQDQCAQQMQVARSTIQNIYDGARKKLAMSQYHMMWRPVKFFSISGKASISRSTHWQTEK